MTTNNETPQFTSPEMLAAETTLKLTAIERLLIKKNIFTADELVEELKLISKEIIEYLKQQNPEHAHMLEHYYQIKNNN